MSRERRFLVDELSGDTAQLEEEQAHHLLRVLRLKPGDEVAVFDGKGRARSARVASAGEDRVELALLGPLPDRESSLELTVAIAPPKGDAMSDILRQLTEIGVARVVPLQTRYTELNPSAIFNRLPRWQRVMIEAAKQCGRSRLPEIGSPTDFKTYIVVGPQAPMLLAHPEAEPLRADPSRAGQSTVLIGPEGGWSEEEIGFAEKRALRMASFGPRTLRTATAAVALAALLQWLGGDWGPPDPSR